MITPAEHLRSALQDLYQQRQSIDGQIEALGKIEQSQPPAMLVTARIPSVADVVLNLLRERQQVTLPEIMEALDAQGNRSQQGSVSSILSRMVRDELLAKPSRGTFARVPQVVSGEQVAALAYDPMDDMFGGSSQPEADRSLGGDAPLERAEGGSD
jgi:predicted transcriptional regulator